MPKLAKGKWLRFLLLLGAFFIVVAAATGSYILFFKPLPNVTEMDVFNKRFSRSLDKSLFRYRPAVTTWEQLRGELSRLRVPYSALAEPKQLEGVPSQVKNDIFSLKFRTSDEKSREVLFYRFSGPVRNNCAVLLIPGTGFDQATKIARGKGYHGKIAETIKPVCDLFVLVKPNQGPLSIHNGKNGLDHRVVRVTLLNDGFSYSVTYLVYAQAIMQYLREKYKKIGVAGLSQGGEASLIIANLERPDFAIVSSGYSILNAEIEYKDITQIIHPNHRLLNKPSAVRQAIKQGKTKYLFSWGLRETNVYGFEARVKKTCKYFSESAPEKITCVFHGGKHVFPLNEVRSFINKQALN